MGLRIGVVNLENDFQHTTQTLLNVFLLIFLMNCNAYLLWILGIQKFPHLCHRTSPVCKPQGFFNSSADGFTYQKIKLDCIVVCSWSQSEKSFYYPCLFLYFPFFVCVLMLFEPIYPHIPLFNLKKKQHLLRVHFVDRMTKVILKMRDRKL